MRKARIGITAEGVPSIGLSALSALVFALLGFSLVAILFLIITFFCCNFFRDPERVVPHAGGLAVSPADGKILHVSTKKDPIEGTERQYIAVYMNVLNVHVNRSPIKARVEDIDYHAGKFLNVVFDKASEDNERCVYTLVDESNHKWYMVQIAGLIARRIVSRVSIGEEMERGERFGMIKFGSRVDIYLPDNMEPAVKLGDIVLAGQSIIARERK